MTWNAIPCRCPTDPILRTRIGWLPLLLLQAAIGVIPAAAQETKESESYPIHVDSQQHDGVPIGTVVAGQFSDSQVFPGTERDYWVYIPRQFDQTKPVALMVFQDGGGYAKRDGGYNVPNVLDNLIHDGSMPVTAAVFINPGVVPPANESAQARFNRSFEYDSTDDRYARFLLEEILPFVESKHGVRFSDNPDDRGICGASSGGICAFAAAWHRPDAFRRVFTTIGTYVGLRGGHEFSTLIRKVEPKPLRVFLQDGSSDLNIYGGDWWMANQALLRSLEFAGYEVDHEWGTGFHSGKHGAAIFPDVMRWLWKDHGKVPVTTHPDNSQHELTRFFDAGDGWEIVSEGHEWAEGLAVADDGTLYFTDVPASKLYRVSVDGKQSLISSDTGNANGIAMGPDGRLYGACGGTKQIRAWNLKTMAMEIVAEGTHANDIVVMHDGTIYYTDPATGKVWMLDKSTRARSEADSLAECNGIALSPDQTQLLVAEFPSRFVYSYLIAADRKLQYKEPFFHLEVPTATLQGQLDGMCCSEDGWLIATSAMGVQICDQPGRSHVILPMPPGSKRPCYAAFGGPEWRTLYVANVDKVLKRKSKLVGARPWQPPVVPPIPRL